MTQPPDFHSIFQHAQQSVDLSNFGIETKNVPAIRDAAIAYSGRVKAIDLSTNNLRDDAINELLTFPQLDTLNLAYNNLTDQCLSVLYQINARKIDLSRNLSITAEGVSDFVSYLEMERPPCAIKEIIFPEHISAVLTERLKSVLLLLSNEAASSLRPGMA